MGPILIVIVILAGVLLLVTAYMEWLGLVSIVTPRSAARYRECGHIKALPVSDANTECWGCRHGRLRHPMHGRHLHGAPGVQLQTDQLPTAQLQTAQLHDQS